ncbi:MAG: hypothetical protein R3190_14035, partial [Thermoanaerobaculia bacterium]|nr:hypothetical protein [Thermoanaerobaculia bacterium]
MAASPEPGASFHLRRLASESGPWLLALVGGAFFWPVLFGGRTLYFRDLELLFFSQRRLFARLVLDGELPLWNTLLHGGTPYLGDISTASLYPTALLYLVLPDLLAFNLEIVAHFVLAGLGAYALARAFGLRQAAALVAGLVFGFCGYSLSLANLFVRLLALPWMAWILLAWHLFLTTGRPRWFAATLACGTLQIFAGAPEAVALTQATLALWTVAAGPFTMAFRRRVGWLLAAGLLTLGLAAIQLVPLFEVLAESPRGGSGVGGEHFSDWSLPPERVPELVAPGYLGPLDTFDEA